MAYLFIYTFQVKKEEAADDDGLGVAQIVITAATPMTEEPEKPFPPPPDEQTVENGEQETDMKPDCEGGSGCEEATKQNEVTSKVIETSVKPIETVVKGRIGKGSKLPSEGSSTEDETTTGPSTADNSQSDRQQPIPDELEPHQLARLQDLKESDA